MRIELIGGHLDGDVLTLAERPAIPLLQFGRDGGRVAVYELRVKPGRTRTRYEAVFLREDDWK